MLQSFRSKSISHYVSPIVFQIETESFKFLFVKIMTRAVHPVHGEAVTLSSAWI